MKFCKNIIVFIIFFTINANSMAQAKRKGSILKQDSIFFKQVDPPNLSEKAETDLPINYSFFFTNNHIGLKIIGKESNEVLDTLLADEVWWENKKDEYTILQTGHKIWNNRTFIYAGLSTTHSIDTNTGESNTFPSFYCFEVDSTHIISLFDFIQNKFSLFTSDYYAIGHTYFWSGGGYSWDCTNYFTYIFTDSSILTPHSYGNCEGSFIFFIDSVYNTIGHMFYYRHPDVGIYRLDFVSYNFEAMWSIENAPWLGYYNTKAISINGNINYSISYSQYYENDWKANDQKIFLLNLNNGEFLDTLEVSEYFIELKSIGNVVYFINSKKEYYIIDHMHSFTDTICVYPYATIGDTLGRICNTNIFGFNVNFKSNHPNFMVDTLNGIITLKQKFNATNSEAEFLQCQFTDGIDTVHREIVISFPLNIIEKASNFKLYPNPCSNILYIKPLNPNVLQSISVFNLHGQEVLNKTNTSSSFINTSQLEPGVYILKLATNSKNYFKKFIVSE